MQLWTPPARDWKEAQADPSRVLPGAGFQYLQGFSPLEALEALAALEALEAPNLVLHPHHFWQEQSASASDVCKSISGRSSSMSTKTEV